MKKKVGSASLNGGSDGNTPEQPRCNHGGMGEHTARGSTSANAPRIRTRSLVKGTEEYQAVTKHARALLANTDYLQLAVEFAADTTIPASQKFMVVALTSLREPPLDFYLLRAQSHQEAEELGMAAAKARGLDPKLCFSTHIGVPLMSH